MATRCIYFEIIDGSEHVYEMFWSSLGFNYLINIMLVIVMKFICYSNNHEIPLTIMINNNNIISSVVMVKMIVSVMTDINSLIETVHGNVCKTTIKRV